MDMDRWAMVVITTSVETLDGSWTYCHTCCILGRTPQTKETMSDFCENIHPDKWDTIVWYRVTRNLHEFHGLTGYQQDPRVLRCHSWTPNFDIISFHDLKCVGISSTFLLVIHRGGKIGPTQWASPSRPKLGPGWVIKLLA